MQLVIFDWHEELEGYGRDAAPTGRFHLQISWVGGNGISAYTLCRKIVRWGRLIGANDYKCQECLKLAPVSKK